MYDIPILFIVFNRKETALKSLESIRRVKPRRLYLASDGARDAREGAIVADVRKSVIDNIDWKCEVRTLFQERNLGCGRGVFTAIDWLFENEEAGIILEDDCIASPTFFPFASEMLTRFAEDTRIGMIAGFNAIPLKDYPYSYLFSRFKSCWGWATWRRTWRNMDFPMEWRKDVYAESILANSGYQGRDTGKWRFELKCIDRGHVSAWDWQWYFSLAAQNQLCIYPSSNQISNIGNDANATHTSLSHVELPWEELAFPLTPPRYVCPYLPFERQFYRNDHTLHAYLTRLIPVPVKNRLKKILSR